MHAVSEKISRALTLLYSLLDEIKHRSCVVTTLCASNNPRIAVDKKKKNKKNGNNQKSTKIKTTQKQTQQQQKIAK